MGAPVADLSKWSPPQRRRQTDDGDTIVEKLSPLPHLMMIDKAGNEIPLPLSNGISNKAKNDPYRAQVLAEKMADGMVRKDLCPLGVSESVPFLPPTVRFRVVGGKPDRDQPKGPCLRAADGGKITAANPCACIAELVRVRREKHGAKDRTNEDRVNKLARLQEQTAQANRDAASGMAAAANGLAAIASQLAPAVAAAQAHAAPPAAKSGKGKDKDGKDDDGR